MLRDCVETRTLGRGWTFLTGRPANHPGMVRYGHEGLQLWAAFPGMAIAKSILWVACPSERAAEALTDRRRARDRPRRPWYTRSS